MMTVQITCTECGSSVEVHPDQKATKAKCDVCQHVMELKFNQDHEKGELHDCPVCARKDFYSQKDFNRKIGVVIFVLTSIATIVLSEIYGPMGLIVFPAIYAIDFFLFRFKKISHIAVCYKCQTIFRNVSNIQEIPGFNHEMNDRIVYSDHDFKGVPLDH